MLPSKSSNPHPGSATSTDPSFTHRPAAGYAVTSNPSRPIHTSASTGNTEAGSGALSSTATATTYKRGPSSSVEGQSPESGASQFGARGNVSALPEDQRNKKRRTGPGSRGVANLTPEQLAKKRANDREAQRAIRERTKNQIETLEKKIEDLTSQRPYQELQRVIREKEAVERENEEIKSRLASVISLLQPYLSNQPDSSGSGPTFPLIPCLLARGQYVSPGPSFTPVQSVQQPQPTTTYSTQNVSTPGSTASPGPANTDLSWRGQSFPQPLAQPEPHQIKPPGQHLDMGSLGFLLDPSQNVKRLQTGVNGAQDMPNFHHLPMKHAWNGAAVPADRDGSNASVVSQSSPQPSSDQHVNYDAGSSLSNPVSQAVVPKNPLNNMRPTCPLDNILLDFLHERHQRVAEGVPPAEIVGPRYPSVLSLLNPQHSVYAHPLSKVFTDVLGTFPAISKLPEKVAVLYIMFLVMRWQVSPTAENWELMPPLARPVQAQIEVPHPAWMDNLPFPAMRDKIARDWSPTEFAFDEFFIPFTTTLSLNWPYEETDALLRSPSGNEIIINPVFERHLRNNDNWTLGPAFDQAFPSLRGTYNLKRDGDTPRSDAGSSVRSRT
ncbi:hypothetical protein GGR57DRAFT_112930 [Xylariaceae sp. FL1272]|nr:hypothetical protein GGR57DRAFT_112930 [Xylariaceae sp. FL1272]